MGIEYTRQTTTAGWDFDLVVKYPQGICLNPFAVSPAGRATKPRVDNGNIFLPPEAQTV